MTRTTRTHRQENADRYRYGLTVKTPPATEAITLDIAKGHLYEDDDHNDAEITQLIKEAREWIEQQTDAVFMETVFTLTMDRFPKLSNWLVLPRWPVVSVDAIRYTASDGTASTLDLSSIVTRLETSGRARIARADWEPWPAVRNTPDAIEIDFTAGHDSASAVPTLWKRAALLLIGHWYENRQAAEEKAIKQIEMGLENILEQMRPGDDLDGFDLG